MGDNIRWLQISSKLLRSLAVKSAGERVVPNSRKLKFLLASQRSPVRYLSCNSRILAMNNKEDTSADKRSQCSSITKFIIHRENSNSSVNASGGNNNAGFSTSCDFSSLHNSSEVDWLNLTQQQEFKNWMKICLGLKVCLDLLSPIINQAVLKSYEKFEHLRIEQNFEPFTFHEVEQYRISPRYDTRLREWVEKIYKMHRHEKFSLKSRCSKNVLRYSDATKWMSSEQGPWEIARFYMTRDFALPPGNSVKTFDASALLRYVDKCTTSDLFIGDIQKAREIAFVRNAMMHCPGYKCSTSVLEKSFQRMFEFVNDDKVKEFEEQSRFLHHLNEVKSAQLTILADKEAGPSLPLTEDKSLKKSTNNASKKEEKHEKKQEILRSIPRHSRSDSNLLTTKPSISTTKRNLHTNTTDEALQSRKRKAAVDDDDSEDDVTMKRRKDSSGRPSKDSKRKKSTKSGAPTGSGASSSGNGGNKDNYYQKKLERLLALQNDSFRPVFTVESRKGLYYASVKFRTLYAAMNEQPRCSEVDAIEAAAIQALKQQGIVGKNRSACKVLDKLCREKTGLPPVYHVAPFNEGMLYFTTLQIFNKESLGQKDKIFLQASVSTSGKDAGVNAEQLAASASLIDSPTLHRVINSDYKRALNEYCLSNGATLPHYTSHLYTTTVTSLRRKSLSLDASSNRMPLFAGNDVTSSTLLNRNDDDSRKNEVEDEQEAETRLTMTSSLSDDTADGGDLDMLEAISMQPMRSVESSEESAAKNMLEHIYGFIPELKEKKTASGSAVPTASRQRYKSQLKEYSDLSCWPVVYHTDKIIPRQKMHDCMVVSKCLKANPNYFLVSCDGKGHPTPQEAREMAARKSLFMIGMENIE